MTARTAAPPPPELSLPWPALRRFFLTVAAWSLALGSPAALLTYTLSQRDTPVYFAEATLLAPLRAVELETGDTPPVATPLSPRTYRSALQSRELLADAWSRLVGQPPEAAAPGALDDLARGLSLRWDESRRSYTIVVGARGPGRDAAIARANAVADALVAWDDARARAAADKVTASLELQLATLEDQLAALRASGSRANLPQIAAVSLLTVRVRDAIALSRAQAVVARGNLEFLQPATRASQVAPSPLVDAFTVFVLTTLAVLAVGLARAGTDRRVHAASGLAEVAGVPMLADLSRAPAPGPGKRGYSELGFLKAHLDRTVGAGGEVLVAGMADHAAVQHVAAALDRLYAQAGAAASVKVGAALLGSGEAIERAARADAVLLVAEPRATDRVELREAMAWLRRASANVIGVVAAGPAGRRPARRTA
ncbi:MAG TPA: hypothetical protein VKY42_10970 [Trueperaceae bacterium]|nr:hypothetical protein [Trueperaceae bacterium]